MTTATAVAEPAPPSPLGNFQIIVGVIVSLAITWGQLSLDAKEARPGPHRTLTYAYDQGDWIYSVIVGETVSGATVEVLAVRTSPMGPAGHRLINISHPEFEQIWSTLNAPGVEKRLVSNAFPVRITI